MVSGFALDIVCSVLMAVFLYALISVLMFVAYVPYNAGLICDTLGCYVPWYVILGAFLTAVLSVVAVVGYCSDQRGVAGVGPKPATTVDGESYFRWQTFDALLNCIVIIGDTPFIGVCYGSCMGCKIEKYVETAHSHGIIFSTLGIPRRIPNSKRKIEKFLEFLSFS
ncbi:hypothetical protein AXG93_1469s1020 [Marchantia polymorpha subsp. ruderalis]|uniref:Uncharacterized protein n=1 Tax=Marchantia polymorpha subsp. ruderalis TaxID=1480154 RepID=A0A176W9N5_MARPO|nr:hypothetical protein AXG93_1469s1020 [Marchantia polymorpha subsp. ruderalis]